MLYNTNDSYDAKIKKKYDLMRISNGIDNAVSAKYEWKRDWSSYFTVVLLFHTYTYFTSFISGTARLKLFPFVAHSRCISNINGVVYAGDYGGKKLPAVIHCCLLYCFWSGCI